MLRHHDRECCKLQDWVFRWWFIRNLSSQSLNTINVRFLLGIVTLYPQIEETVGRQNRYCPLHYFRFSTRRVTAELVIHFGSSFPCPWDIGNGPKIAVSNLQGTASRLFPETEDTDNASVFFFEAGASQKKAWDKFRSCRGVHVTDTHPLELVALVG